MITYNTVHVFVVLTRRGDAIVINVSVAAASTDAGEAQRLARKVASRGSKKFNEGSKEKVDETPQECVRSRRKDDEEEQRQIQLHDDDNDGSSRVDQIVMDVAVGELEQSYVVRIDLCVEVANGSVFGIVGTETIVA